MSKLEKLSEELRGRSLLYVEDNENVREKVVSLLQLFEINIIEAKDGKEGLVMFRRHRPDIIMSDINMPKMSGLDMAAAIRRIDQDTPIIMITAYKDEELLFDAIEHQINRYMMKPVNKNQIIDALQKCVEIIKRRPKTITFQDGLTYDISKKQLFRDEEIIVLTNKEIKLLELLVNHRNMVVTYDMIEQSLWKGGGMTIEALRTLVRSFRRKSHPDLIQNLSGIGYRLEVSE